MHQAAPRNSGLDAGDQEVLSELHMDVGEIAGGFNGVDASLHPAWLRRQ